MNILIKLTCLIGLVIAPILGEGTATHVEQIEVEELPKMSMVERESPNVFSRTNLFVVNMKEKAIESFTLDAVDCMNTTIVCKEIMKLSREESMTFKANSKVKAYYMESEFEREVEGIFTIGEEDFKATLLFNLKNNHGMYFTGNLIFETNSVIKSTDKVSIYVKGKQ